MTDPMWCYENPLASAAQIDRLRAELAAAEARGIAVGLQIADEACSTLTAPTGGAHFSSGWIVAREKCRDAIRARDLPHDPIKGDEGRGYQPRVMEWLLACFGPGITNDRVERVHRFWEEALELGQSAGCTASEAHQLVDYVFGRPTGELGQEIGGTMVCLAALCAVHNIDMDAEAERELARVWTKVEKIRAKHAAKPRFSPLPGPSAGDEGRGG